MVVGNTKEYSDIPCSPKNLVKIILFNNPNARINKFVTNKINVFFKMMFFI